MNPSDPGSLIALRHFSLDRPVTCSLVSGDLENFFTIRLTGPIGKYMEIYKGDPIIFSLMASDTSDICGGFILSRKESNITISPDITPSIIAERRKSPRYPVSLLGSISHVNGRECEIPARVKDISQNGIRIYTESEFNVQDHIGIRICAGDIELDIEGAVVRCARLFGRNEYGIQLIHRHKKAEAAVRANIEALVEREKKMIEEALLASNG